MVFTDGESPLLWFLLSTPDMINHFVQLVKITHFFFPQQLKLTLELYSYWYSCKTPKWVSGSLADAQCMLYALSFTKSLVKSLNSTCWIFCQLKNVQRHSLSFLSHHPFYRVWICFYPERPACFLLLSLKHKSIHAASLSIQNPIHWVKSFYLTYFLLEAMSTIDLCVCCSSVSSIFFWASAFSSFSPEM